MRDLWFAEHGIVEWATTLVLLGTALLAARLWLRRRFLLRFLDHRLYLAIVFPLALLALLGELEFGYGFIDHEPPIVLQDYRIKSVHDFLLPLAKSFRLALGLDTASAAVVLTAGVIMITALLAWVFRYRIAALVRRMDMSALRPAWLSLGCALALLAPALLFDSVGPVLGGGWASALQIAEELLELAAAVSLLWGMVWLRRLEGHMAADRHRAEDIRPPTRPGATAYAFRPIGRRLH